jgi:hypothetical protein
MPAFPSPASHRVVAVTKPSEVRMKPILIALVFAAVVPLERAHAMSPEQQAVLEHQLNPKEAKLTDDQVIRFIALTKAQQATRRKLAPKDTGANKPAAINMARIMREAAEIRTLPAKFGFNGDGDLIDINWTINGLVSQFDLSTGERTDPIDRWKKKIAEAEKQTGSSPEEIEYQKENIANLKDILKQTEQEAYPKDPDNIALVKKHLNAISAARQY